MLISRNRGKGKLLMYAKKQYVKVLNQAWDELEQRDWKETATRCALRADGGAYLMDSLGHTLRVEAGARQIFEPGGRPVRPIFQIVLLHHLLRDSGEAPAGEDIPIHTFHDLMLYHNTIKWRSLDILAGAYGTRPELLESIGARLGGEPRGIGDGSVMLRPMPRIRWTAVIHAEDDEFPAEAQILFDKNATAMMHPEDMVVLSELLAHRLANMANSEAGYAGDWQDTAEES